MVGPYQGSKFSRWNKASGRRQISGSIKFESGWRLEDGSISTGFLFVSSKHYFVIYVATWNADKLSQTWIPTIFADICKAQYLFKKVTSINGIYSKKKQFSSLVQFIYISAVVWQNREFQKLINWPQFMIKFMINYWELNVTLSAIR